VPAFSITQNGDTNTLDAFTLTRTGDVVRAEAPLANGLHIIKEYRLSTNYLLKASIRYENREPATCRFARTRAGDRHCNPDGHRNETTYLGLEWYNGSDNVKITEPWFANKTLGCLPGTPGRNIAREPATFFGLRLTISFFTIIGVPETPAMEIVGRHILLPPPSKEELANDPSAFCNSVWFSNRAGSATEHHCSRSVCRTALRYFRRAEGVQTLQTLPRDMDRVMGFSGFFGFFCESLLLSMNGLAAIGIPYGVAIIVITVIIKLIFWPLTNASTKSMKRMAALQPQMKAIQEKYKDDPRKMNQKTMEFMKEHKVSPLGGCLPVLLQIPVFFGFYRMLQSAIELRGAHFLWACDLSQPDTLFYIAGFPVNPLPLIMGVTMLWQARLTPPSPGMDPAQQQIMRYMPLMMMVFLYNFQAGLTLYWTVQNLLSIAQMKITRSGS
jgi:YidC/Oxa1 family membrane protein insertase